MKTNLTEQELNAVKEAAESVAARYIAISKRDFLIEVKDLVPTGKNHIKTALAVWDRYYAD